MSLVHPQGAKILLIGEAWGEVEERTGQPFMGQAGNALNGILEEVGIPRAQVAITNVVHERPPRNNFKVYYEKVKNRVQPTAKLLEAYQRLYMEIYTVRPNVIVPLGVEALKAVTGEQNIMSWRGSVMDSPHGKVIPTIHPAKLLRQWRLRPAVVVDFERIHKEQHYEEIRRTPRKFDICRSKEEAQEFFEEAKGSEWLAFDVEVESNQITCIGLSCRPHRSVSIPFWFGASGSLWTVEDEKWLWGELRGLLESDTPKKIAQSGMYDLEVIESCMGFRPKLHFDTMYGFHVLYPEFPKKLEFLTSIYTDHPYYKFQRRAREMDTHFVYNATDACLTLECALCIHHDLMEAGLLGFYQDYVHALITPLLDMQQRGVLFDTDKRDRLRKQYRYDVSVYQHKLEQQVGHPLNVASAAQMKKWLYGTLKLKKRYTLRKTTGEKTESTDEEALHDIYKETKNEAVQTVLSIRERQKILSTYLDVRLDSDKRIRCSYRLGGTETGRLSSSKTSRGTGTNLQNIPTGVVRELFIPDGNKTFINADLSQAEARVVAYLADEQRLIELFERGGDIHRKNASNIFKVDESDVTQEQRELAKRCIHASHYGIGPRTFAATIGSTEAEAKRLLNTYMATYPRIKQWHLEVEGQLKRSRTMTTPFGRKRTFFSRWGLEVLKEGLAYVPQSTVADILNQGLLAVHAAGIDVLLQVHDSILVQAAEEDIVYTIDLMKDLMTIPVEIKGRIMVIPVDFKIGSNWGKLYKWPEGGK